MGRWDQHEIRTATADNKLLQIHFTNSISCDSATHTVRLHKYSISRNEIEILQYFAIGPSITRVKVSFFKFVAGIEYGGVVDGIKYSDGV